MPSKPPQSKAQKKANRTAKKQSGHILKKRLKKRLLELQEDETWDNIAVKKRIVSVAVDAEKKVESQLIGLASQSVIIQQGATLKQVRKKGHTKRMLKVAIHEKGTI